MTLDDGRGENVDNVGGEATDIVGHPHQHARALEMVVALDMHLLRDQDGTSQLPICMFVSLEHAIQSLHS